MFSCITFHFTWNAADTVGCVTRRASSHKMCELVIPKGSLSKQMVEETHGATGWCQIACKVLVGVCVYVCMHISAAVLKFDLFML